MEDLRVLELVEDVEQGKVYCGDLQAPSATWEVLGKGAGLPLRAPGRALGVL